MKPQIENFHYVSHVKNIVNIFIIPSWFVATVVHSNFKYFLRVEI